MIKKLKKILGGCYVGTIESHEDLRGYIIKSFDKKKLKQINRILKKKFIIKEILISESHKNVFRGMHFQRKPKSYDKIVYLNNGKIEDRILDLRNNSPTFGQHYKITMTSKKNNILIIPAGFAHGFLSLSKQVKIMYLLNNNYNDKLDSGINYKSLNLDLKKKNISNRDLFLKNFNKKIKYF